MIDFKEHVNDLYSCQPLDFYICNDDFVMLSSSPYSQSPKIPVDDATTAFLRSTLNRDEKQQPFYIKVVLETNIVVVVDSISADSSHKEQQPQKIIIVAYLLQSDPKQQNSCYQEETTSVSMTWGIVNADAGAGVETPPGPTIRGNPEKGEEVELTATFVAVFLLILFGAIVLR